MKRIFCATVLIVSAIAANAGLTDTLTVKSVKVAGPYSTKDVMFTTRANAEGRDYDGKDVAWDTEMNLNLWKASVAKSLPAVITDSSVITIKGKGIYQLGFTVQNTRYQKMSFRISSKGRNSLYVDETKRDNNVALSAGRHECVVKLQETGDDADTVRIQVLVERIDSLKGCYTEVNPTGRRYYSFEDQMSNEHIGRTRISATGRYVYQQKYITKLDGNNDWTKEIIDTRTGNRYNADDFVQWAAKDDRYITTSRNRENHIVYKYKDVQSGRCTTLFTYAGKNNVQFCAGDTKMLVSERVDGPREKNSDVHQILTPDDRIEGWRNRYNLSIIDVKTGEIRQLTRGTRTTGGNVSEDGSKIILTSHWGDTTKRPFSFSSCYLMDLNTGVTDTIYACDGFVSSAIFSPDATQILFEGSAEAFGGIGNVCPEGMIPNIFDHDLFLYDIKTRKFTPLTAHFNPSVTSMYWSKADGCIYAYCEDKDEMGIFRLNPRAPRKNGEYNWTRLNLNENYVFSGWDMASNKAVISYVGQSATTAERSWVMDISNGKQVMLDDLNPKIMSDIRIGECRTWTFKTERGDSIYGCYYLPPYFDANKKYPMLVYYYGGCSPVGRYLNSSYNYEAWASMGYVVYVLQPSGCSGFGQEFAARHSNAYGDYTASDIISGTKQFCKEHPFVNEKKIGCLGASYGGFMTQYLQTQTDIFAAAVSHAGISNPTSYWGEGYWGYSYSACAAPNSYPWNNATLYTEHAPLFNADKIHTPLLFMHGSVDTNVPVGESIQMFNALKILGRETAFIIVDGENHYISNFHKRIKWHNSIMAWFQKWLQDDPTWWNDLYPEKNL